MGDLIWPPIEQAIVQRIEAGDSLRLVISPFIKLDALKNLVERIPAPLDVKIVVRWTPADLVAGVSDLSVYPYLHNKGIQLFVNKSIHLKLYVFESNHALNTSGNLTQSGMGTGKTPNIEAGSFARLSVTDWGHIYRIIDESSLVDETYYSALNSELERYKKENPQVEKEYFKNIPAPERKAYSLSSLPASDTPDKLRNYYLQIASPQTTDEVRRAIHDLVLFQIKPGLSPSEFTEQLRRAFQESPFVVDFVSYLKAQSSLRFGAVADWIHRKCEDVPLPYRWQVKENVRVFYDWLVYFFPKEISWDTPRHSQVIYWKG